MKILNSKKITFQKVKKHYKNLQYKQKEYMIINHEDNKY